jgi:Zn2+/Cd2+-exporting ATPase
MATQHPTPSPAHHHPAGACCGSREAHPASSAPALPPEPGAARFRISTMDCAVEASEIRQALEPIAGISALRFDLGRRVLSLRAEPPVLAAALAAIRQRGYEPQALPDAVEAGGTAAEPPLASGLPRLIASLLFALFAEGLAYFAPNTLAFQLGEVGLAALAIGLAGFETYHKGFYALRVGRLNINALMAVAVTGAFLIGQWPEAAMVMALYAMAELIEARAVDRARHAIQSLLAMAPEQAEVQQADGSWQDQPCSAVAVGALVRIRPGERVPLDGVVTQGSSAVNQAPVTGESLPVDKTEGDELYAGSLNQTSALTLRVTALASNSTLARILHAV